MDKKQKGFSRSSDTFYRDLKGPGLSRLELYQVEDQQLTTAAAVDLPVSIQWWTPVFPEHIK